MDEQFVLKAALAESQRNELVELGCVNFGRFILEFRQFDWVGEVTREYWRGLSTPALGVMNLHDQSTFWVAAYDWLRLLNPSGGPSHMPALSYYVGLNDGPCPPDIYCRKEDRDMVNCEFGADSPDVVESLFSLYFRERYSDLYKQLFELPIQ